MSAIHANPTAALLSVVRCPNCYSALRSATKSSSDASTDLYLECTGCPRHYLGQGGVIDFLTDLPEEVTEERSGNRDMASHVRADADDAWLLGLPESFVRYVPSQVQHNVRADFESMVAHLGLPPGARVLDLGAGCCWTSRFLAESGLRVIANDVSAEKYVGLASGDVYMAAGTPHFDRLLFDMCGSWPIGDASIDAIVAFCSIHHAHDLGRMFQEAARVLRVDGRLVLVEAGRALIAWPEERSFGHVEAKDFHANEHKHNILAYRHHAMRAGFSFRTRVAGSVRQKVDWLLHAPTPDINTRGMKYRVASAARPLLRSLLIRRLLFGPFFPMLCLLFGVQFVGVCELDRRKGFG
jgi:SAM-dependent methyltransferase